MSEKSWISRNGCWVIPLGCLLLLGAPFVCCFGGVGGLMGFVRFSDVTQTAFETARTDPRVIAELGEPVKLGLTVSGNFNKTSDGKGSADLQLPLSGPKASGTLFVEARQMDGEWTFNVLELRVEREGASDTYIDLLSGNPPRGSTPPETSREAMPGVI